MTDTNEERRTRPIADFLAEHNRGQGARQASEALQRVVGAVMDTGKKGSVTVTISVEPMKNQEGTMVTSVVVTEKTPVLPPKSAIFYADSEHNLIRTDPRQPAFETMRSVDGPEVREAPAAPPVRAGGGEA